MSQQTSSGVKINHLEVWRTYDLSRKETLYYFLLICPPTIGTFLFLVP